MKIVIVEGYEGKAIVGDFSSFLPADPPDTSWVEMVCVCCLDYDGEHVSRWHKIRNYFRTTLTPR